MKPGLWLFDEHTGGSGEHSVFKIAMTVLFRASNCDKQVAGTYLATIAYGSRNTKVPAVDKTNGSQYFAETEL